MQNAPLMSHVDTDLVPRKQLALVETPDATPSFKPVPHIELIDTLEHVLKLNHITIRKEQFALRRDGLTLFGVLQFAYQDTPDGMAALGLRTSKSHDVDPNLRGTIGVRLRQHGLSRGPDSARPQTHFGAPPENRAASAKPPLCGSPEVFPSPPYFVPFLPLPAQATFLFEFRDRSEKCKPAGWQRGDEPHHQDR